MKTAKQMEITVLDSMDNKGGDATTRKKGSISNFL